MSAEWQWERPDTLGSRLRFLRESFGLKARTAAMAVGFDDQSWRNWEAGIHAPSADKVERIARRFEGRSEDDAKRLAAWIAFGGPLPPHPQPSDPFVSPITKSEPPVPKRPGKAQTRRNSVYNSVPSRLVAA